MRYQGLVLGILLLTCFANLTSLNAATKGRADYEQSFTRLSREVLAHPEHADTLLKLHDLKELRGKISRPDQLYILCDRLLSRRIPFEIRLQANWFKLEQAWETGDVNEISKAITSLGLVTRWQVMGPFENEGGLGMAEQYGPESGYDAAESYPGKVRQVSWRSFPPISRYTGYQDFKTIYTPYTQTVAYAYARIFARRASEAVLLLGVGGETRVWLNEKLAAEWKGDRPKRRWQSAYRVRLKRGANNILVKVGGRDNDWGFRLALVDRKGKAIPHLFGINGSAQDEARAPFPSEARSWQLGEELNSKAFPLTLEMLEKRFQKKPSADLALSISRLHRLRHAYPLEQRLHEEYADRALELSPDHRESLLWCSKVFSDHNRRLQCLNQGRERYPDDPRLALALAIFYVKEGRELTARRMLEPLLKDPAVQVEAAQAMALLFKWRGFPWEGQRLLEEMNSKKPGLRAIRQSLARIYDRMGMQKEARALWQGLYEENSGSTGTLRSMYEFYLQRRETVETLKWVDRILELNPGSIADYLRKARLFEGEGRYQDAQQVYLDALAISPEENTVLDRLATLKHYQGKGEQALALWRQSLEIHPQNPTLKQYLRLLEPQEQSFEAPYVENAQRIAALYPPEAEGKDTAEDLLNLTVWKVFENGLSSRFNQNIVRVKDDNGVKAYKTSYIYYSPYRQEVKILKARILKADGEIVERYEEREQSLSKDYQIYYDRKAVVITFPDLKPGDVVELQYRLDDVGRENLFADYFGTINLIQGRIPVRRWKTVILMPKAKSLYFNKPRLSPEPQINKSADSSEYVWDVMDAPKVRNEPSAPPFVEIADYLHVSTFKDWKEMGSWYWGLIREQFTAKDDLKQKVDELVGDLTAVEEKIRVIQNFVATKTRYVGLEFGIHSFKPYQVNQIYQRRFGDCKDKATLMIAMLKHAGIRAWMAIIRTGNIGALQEYPPSLTMFNHAIVYLPDQDLYIDGTAEQAGMLELPFQNRRGQVMLISDEGALFTRVPAADPRANVFSETSRLTLAEGDTAIAEGDVTIQGSRASSYRSHFQDTDRRKEMLEKLINREHPGAELVSFDFKNVSNINMPVRFSYKARLPAHLRRQGEGYAIYANMQRWDLVKRFAVLSTRQHPVEIPRLQTLNWESQIDLNGRFKVADLPEDVSLEGDFGKFEMRIVDQGGRLQVKTLLTFSANRIEVNQYPDFRAFCQEVTHAFQQEIKLIDADPTI